MKAKNLNIRKKAVALAATGLLATAVLTTGCNQQVMDFELKYNKAIIFHENTATIVEVKHWNDYEGEQLQLITKDGLVIVTSSYDTKLINDEKSLIKAEDVARSIGGDDIEIRYLEKHEKDNVKTK
ncbi:MAG: hypothetical protein IK137_00445 [Bacilli bacterium]|nr:hypothetical protein [Bacilli bacterium]